MSNNNKLSKIHGIDAPTEIPDPTTDELLNETIEKNASYEAEKLKQEQYKTQKLEHEIKCLQDDRSARKIYGYAIFGFVFLYITVVLLLFSFQVKLQLPESTVITLLSTTSINVVGLFAAVVRYVFPRRDGN